MTLFTYRTWSQLQLPAVHQQLSWTPMHSRCCLHEMACDLTSHIHPVWGHGVIIANIGTLVDILVDTLVDTLVEQAGQLDMPTLVLLVQGHTPLIFASPLGVMYRYSKCC